MSSPFTTVRTWFQSRYVPSTWLLVEVTQGPTADGMPMQEERILGKVFYHAERYHARLFCPEPGVQFKPYLSRFEAENALVNHLSHVQPSIQATQLL